MRLPSQLLRRKTDSHKGDFGHIFILAGSPRFSGAAVLCSEAAMFSGAGMVTLGVPASLNNPIIQIKPKEVMTLPLPETKEGTLSLTAFRKIADFIQGIDVLVVGPGLGQNKSTQELIRKVISKVNKPKVIDADGLNALVGHLNILLNTQYSIHNTILTPHPGEMARLLGINISGVQKDRKNIAIRFANKYNITIVLKGNDSVVADSKGNLYINRTGNPGMATAGSGDVLSGIIAAFLGQGLRMFDAAKFATYIHGLAGDLAAKSKTQMGMVASDIIEKIPKALKKCS
jgi:NAD(P)H-hydrate epimerase